MDPSHLIQEGKGSSPHLAKPNGDQYVQKKGMGPSTLDETTMTQAKRKEALKEKVAIETPRIEEKSDESPFVEAIEQAQIIEIIKVLYVISYKLKMPTR